MAGPVVSAAATAAGYLYASGRLRHLQRRGKSEKQLEAEAAAVALRKEREEKEKQQRRKP